MAVGRKWNRTVPEESQNWILYQMLRSRVKNQFQEYQESVDHCWMEENEIFVTVDHTEILSTCCISA